MEILRHLPFIGRILQKFEETTLNWREVLVEQTRVGEQSPSPELATFCLRVSQEFFMTDIEVEFYAEIDGATAHVTPPLKKIWINCFSEELRDFHKMSDEYGKVSPALFMKNHSKLIVKWLDTISHELSHLDENSPCNLHDPAFNRLIAKKMKCLLQNSHVVFEILCDVLSKKND